jgi:hypothetical protein
MTKAVFVTSIGAVLFGAVLFGCWVAVHFGWALDGTGRLKLGDLSSWLQFVVTFVAVLAAVLTACHFSICRPAHSWRPSHPRPKRINNFSWASCLTT